MSSDLFEVLSLAARYLFTLLGTLIVLRAFGWLITDTVERRRRLRSLPDAGLVGEMVVLSGGGASGVPDGSVLPLPWEGDLGSVRSCDLCLPCPGVQKQHLRFSFQVGKGLRILPRSGCEVVMDGNIITYRSGEKASFMNHGSFLQVGSALLRLRLFTGLDPQAGFTENDNNSSFSESSRKGNVISPLQNEQEFIPYQSGETDAASAFSPPARNECPLPPFSDSDGGFLSPMVPEADRIKPPLQVPEQERHFSVESIPDESCKAPARRNRSSDRWEADWSD